MALRVGQGATSAQLADAIVRVWQEVDVALSPIIGHRGVAALYKRSVHLAARAHPWLAGAQQGLPTSKELATLESLLAQQRVEHAAAAGGDLLQTFHELLASLVGPSLTERLLRSVWATLSSGPSAQDTSP